MLCDSMTSGWGICRLLEHWQGEARRHGVPSHKVIAWIRRKIGNHITIVRYLNDGSLACAIPCVFCQKELKKYDMRISCTTEDGTWFHGRLSDGGAPTPVLTAGQRRMLKRD